MPSDCEFSVVVSMNLRIVPYTYKYKVPFEIARERRTIQKALFIGLEFDGFTGWGECTTNSYYEADVDQFVRIAAEARPMLREMKPEDPRSLYGLWEKLFSEHPFLRSAFDLAAWDLYGKMKSKSVQQLLGLKRNIDSKSCLTFGMDDPSLLVTRIIKQPWPIYKIKMGQDSTTELFEEISEVTNAQLHVDANASWTLSKSIMLIPRLAQLGVSLVEQPLAVSLDKDMIQLKGRFRTPFFADESFGGGKDLNRCADAFDGLNFKLQKLGGISPTIDLIDKAKKKGLKIMIGCMTESSLGLSAAAQLASLAEHLDLDSLHLIDNDPALGLRVEAKGVFNADLPGLGAILEI